jgi:hypothetical protein
MSTSTLICWDSDTGMGHDTDVPGCTLITLAGAPNYLLRMDDHALTGSPATTRTRSFTADWAWFM